MIYCYLRVSSLLQDEQNQRQGIEAKAKSMSMKIDEYYVDKISGITDPNKRNLGTLLKLLKRGDVLIVSEISRLGRSLLMIMSIIKQIIDTGAELYSVKEGFKLGDDIQSKCLVFAYGLSAEIERNLISQRTREALAYRKALGIKLGRPVGSKTKHSNKIDPIKDEMIKHFQKHHNKSETARKFHLSLKTVRKVIKNTLGE